MLHNNIAWQPLPLELGFGSGRTSQAATTSITHACNARRGAVMRRIT
ncbi:hypothetical protein [Streptomyces sp. NPDC048001]